MHMLLSSGGNFPMSSGVEFLSNFTLKLPLSLESPVADRNACWISSQHTGQHTFLYPSNGIFFSLKNRGWK